MKGWETVKLGKLISESKVVSSNPDVTKRIRVKLNVGGVEKRPEIIEDLPPGWVSCRLGEFVYCERGRFSARPRNDPQFYNGEFPFIQIGDLPPDGGTKQSINRDHHLDRIYRKF